jgi:hypothetical protein
MLHVEVLSVYIENHTQHKCTGKFQKLFNVKVDETHDNHRS